MTKKKLTYLERAKKGAAASPWKRHPSCPTYRAAKIFKANQSTPHPDEKKPK